MRKKHSTTAAPKSGPIALPGTPRQAIRVWQRLIDDLAQIGHPDGRQVRVYAAFSTAVDMLIAEASRLNLGGVAILKVSRILRDHAAEAASKWNKTKPANIGGWCRVATADLLPSLVKLNPSELQTFSDGLDAAEALKSVLDREGSERDRAELMRQQETGKPARKPAKRGRPHNKRIEKVCRKIAKESVPEGGRRQWKTLLCRFESELPNDTTPDALRSAFRRYEQRPK